MKIIINPQYSRIRSFIENIPTRFEQEGELIYSARNQLKSYQVDGFNVVVKRFRKPHYINRIAYSFLRPSKAQRAYEYARKLLTLDVHTPAPIAYIIDKKSSLIELSYFISIYENNYVDIRRLMLGEDVNEDLLRALGTYIASFHAKGVLHLDMSPGNILYKQVAGEYLFTLVDINRMQFFDSLSNEQRFKSFKRLSDNQEVLKRLAVYYAQAGNLPTEETVEQICRYSSLFFNSRKMKRRKK